MLVTPVTYNSYEGCLIIYETLIFLPGHCTFHSFLLLSVSVYFSQYIKFLIDDGLLYLFV